jgi:hypothetical protein
MPVREARLTHGGMFFNAMGEYEVSQLFFRCGTSPPWGSMITRDAIPAATPWRAA